MDTFVTIYHCHILNKCFSDVADISCHSVSFLILQFHLLKMIHLERQNQKLHITYILINMWDKTMYIPTNSNNKIFINLQNLVQPNFSFVVTYTVEFKRVRPPTRKLYYLSLFKLTTATRVVFLCCYSYFLREGLTGSGMESVTVILEVGENLW